MSSSKDLFDIIVWRIGFYFGSHWLYFRDSDGKKWRHIGLGFYWRITP